MSCRGCCIFLSLVIISTVVFILALVFLKKGDKQEIECFADYLRQKGEAHDECFNSIGAFYGDKENCNYKVGFKLESFYNQTEEKISKKVVSRQNITCVINRLKSLECYGNNFLLSQILDYSKISLKFWKFFERRSNLKVVDNRLRRLEDKEIEYCAKTTQKEDEVVEKSTINIDDIETTTVSKQEETSTIPTINAVEEEKDSSTLRTVKLEDDDEDHNNSDESSGDIRESSADL